VVLSPPFFFKNIKMAINVNTVYNTVLTILNKEQRGYLTPDEFNQVGSQVQLELFEKYFEDYNQYIRMPKTDVEFASKIDHILEEIQIFELTNNSSKVIGSNTYLQPDDGVLTASIISAGSGYASSGLKQTTTTGLGTGCTVNAIVNNGLLSSVAIVDNGKNYVVGDVLKVSLTNGNQTQGTIVVNSLADKLYRFGSAYYNKGVNSPEIEIVTSREYTSQTLSPLTQPSTSFPIAKYNNNNLIVYPKTITPSTSDVYFNYIRKPKNIRWGYKIGELGQYIYDPTVYNPSSLALGDLQIVFNGTGLNGIYTLNQTASASAGSSSFQTDGAGINAKLSLSITGVNPVTLSPSNAVLSVTGSGTGFAIGDTLTIAADSIAAGNPSSNLSMILTEDNLLGGSTQGSIDFEIDSNQQYLVILEILKYAGVIIRDPQIIQAVSQELAQDEVNSKR